MRPSIASIAVVLLVVTAGCGGFVGDDGGTETDESADDELLPGLTESAVTDRHALLREHYTALEDEGYRIDWERTVSDASGTVLEFENGSTEVAADRTPARERFVREDENGSVEVERWSDGETTIVRQNQFGSVTYVPGSRVPVEPTPPIPLGEAYDAVDSVAVEDGADERYVLEGTAEELGSYESVSFTLVLAADGYLAAYALEGELAKDDDAPFAADRAFVEEEFALEPTESEPEEPNWLEDGLEEITEETDG
ncbi:hypothetical protein CV102_03665 [Natronococcus pandeyae]|uniref:Uncharacterized protein n=1 Tax=Natronococcus pandeyae TaxID=2055836 RepID=A0A8J8TUB6_9EURY|nr:hypothetical protein [Natronococcus pandeyae]TYL40672.1 hypothetical protein CV102_03665 [Natronococcus pandeyae]